MEKVNDMKISELNTDLAQTNLNVGNKVGILWHPTMLLHVTDKDDPDDKAPPVENPNRLKSILAHLTEKRLLDKCECVTEFKGCNPNLVTLAHPLEYLSYVQALWPPQDPKETSFYVKDTYFCKDSEEAARLCIEATNIAVDNVLKGTWSQAFALTRPPGHHAGVDGIIEGYCIYNTVPISARYAQKTYPETVKRIAIIDWDVHHGDSTQVLLYDDPSILYISFHRYDNGEFYPGQRGDPSNIGEGNGKGFNVNIAWNCTRFEPFTVGTNEYVFAFERIVAPLLAEFKPDLTFISSGFDSSEGDPLGKISLDVDGYAYMTRRILELTVQARVIIVLEGGYNLEMISKSSEACLRVLQGERIPLEISKNGLNTNIMRESCNPNSIGKEAVEAALAALTSFWPCLSSEEVLNYQQRIFLHQEQLTKLKSIIVSGHAGLFLLQDDLFLKVPKKAELDFYTNLNNQETKYYKESQALLKFIPKFHGTEKIGGKMYLKLSNISHGLEKGSVIDLKIGKITYLPNITDPEKIARKIKRCAGSTSEKLGFRVSGLIIKDSKGEILQKLKKRDEIDAIISADTITEHLKRVLLSNERDSIDPEMVNQIIEYLNDLIDWFDKVNRSRIFVASSILLIVDNTVNKFRISFLDFGQIAPMEPPQEKDSNVIDGLLALRKCFLDMKKNL